MAIPEALFREAMEELATWVRIYPEIAAQSMEDPLIAINNAVERVNQIDSKGIGQLTREQSGLRETLRGWEQMQELMNMEPAQLNVFLYRLLDARPWDDGGGP